MTRTTLLTAMVIVLWGCSGNDNGKTDDVRSADLAGQDAIADTAVTPDNVEQDLVVPDVAEVAAEDNLVAADATGDTVGPVDAVEPAEVVEDVQEATDIPGTCPIPVIKASTMQGEPIEEGGWVQTWQIQLDGTDSSSPNGEIMTYKWSASYANKDYDPAPTFDPGPSAAKPTLSLMPYGETTVQLEVFDTAGYKSCEPAMLTFAAYSDDLWIQVFWSTEGGDPSANNAVHLHLLHPYSEGEGLDITGDGEPDGWWSVPWDCNWHNNWKAIWNEMENTGPAIDIEGNPQNLQLTQAGEQTYRFGVIYWYPNGFGYVDVTARIYIRGQLAWDKTVRLHKENDIWEAADIKFPEGEVIELSDENGDPIIYPEVNVDALFQQ